MNFETRDTGLSDAAWRWLAEWLGMPALLATPARAMDDIALAPSRLADPARDRLAALLGPEQVRTDDAARMAHGGSGLIAMLQRRAGDVTLAPDAVLSPRTEAEAAAAVRACADMDIAIGAHDARVRVAMDLSHMTRLTVDPMSGLADVEAGLGSADLARRLAARGMAADIPAFDGLGDFIAHQRGLAWLHGARLATPMGLADGMGAIAAGSRNALGIVTSATLRVRAISAETQARHYLFPDFAAGLAALHQAARNGIAHSQARLWDGPATHFARGLARMDHPFDLTARLHDAYLALRRFDDRAGALSIAFPGTDARKAFDALAARAGGMRLWRRIPSPDLTPLLDRGVNADRFIATASWSKLPGLYAAARHRLDKAMRAAVPRPGAHGLVLATLEAPHAHGATLRLDAIYPRKLDAVAAQAAAIHEAGSDALRTPPDATSRMALAAIKQALDPKTVLPPL